jgi:hypothetical protein
MLLWSQGIVVLCDYRIVRHKAKRLDLEERDQLWANAHRRCV